MAGMMAASPRVSFADLEQWPEDGRRYELYDGEVYVVPSPLPLHQVVSANLHLALTDYVREHGGVALYAPLDIVLTDYDVVQPDLLLFTRQRQDLINLRKVTRHSPDLAIEILSPSTASNDRGRKMIEATPMRRGGTNPTAAAIGLLQLVEHEVSALTPEIRHDVSKFLAEMTSPEGGLRALGVLHCGAGRGIGRRSRPRSGRDAAGGWGCAVADRLLVDVGGDGRVSVSRWLDGEYPSPVGQPEPFQSPLSAEELEELRVCPQ